MSLRYVYANLSENQMNCLFFNLRNSYHQYDNNLIRHNVNFICLNTLIYFRCSLKHYPIKGGYTVIFLM